MTKEFAPLLAATVDPMKDPNVFSKLKFPLLASPKLDGIRNVVRNGVCMSRKLLPIPSAHVQALFSMCEHMDGELIVGNPADPDVYNRTQSYVMSKNKAPSSLGLPIGFYVFDWADVTYAADTFQNRLKQLAQVVGNNLQAFGDCVFVVPHYLVTNLEDLLAIEESILAEGYEGIMLRHPDGPYKHGRSTFKEHTLLKLKRFTDAEGTLVGVVEQMTNTNEAKVNELGHTKRSTTKDGMVPAGTLGKILVDFGGVVLEVGCGVMTKGERQDVWNNPNDYLGSLVKFRYFAHGMKDKPRFPRFVGWRSPEDM